MDFTLSEEQQMVKDSTRKLMEKLSSFDARRNIIAQGSFCEKHWEQYADMGLLSIAVPEEYGGMGTNPVDAAIVMEECGRVLLVEPLWSIAILAAQTLVSSGDKQKCKDLLPALMEGKSKLVLAHKERLAEGTLEYVATRAKPVTRGTWQINGEKNCVIGGNNADHFLVSARTSGADDEESGISLFLIPRNTDGLHAQKVRLVDNRWSVHLTLVDVEVTEADIIGELNTGFGALRRAHDYAMIGLCAEAVGVMEQALWITRDYLKVRKQFGTAISDFQSVQHRLAEMLIELELSRSMLFKALSSFDDPNNNIQSVLSAVKAHIGSSGKFICGQAIQLHGGIGVTEEYIIGHHFKRMILIENEFGNSSTHLQRLAKLEQQPSFDNPTENKYRASPENETII